MRLFGTLSTTAYYSGETQLQQIFAPISVTGVASSPSVSVNNRAPKFSDNSTKGYTIDSIWQYAGQAWKPIASDSTSAVWQAQPALNARPIDWLGTSCQFAGGTKAMKTNYTGPAIDIQILVASALTSYTINILSSGELDNQAVFTVLINQDSNDFIRVTKLYDQTGNQNHFIVAPPFSAMSLVWDIVLNGFVICPQDNTNNSVVARGLQIPSGITFNGNNYGMFAFGRGLVSSDNNQGVIVNIGDYTGVGDKSLVWQTVTNGNIQKWTTEQSSRVPPITQLIDCAPTVYSLIGDSGGTVFGNNEIISKNTTIPTSMIYSGGWLGNFKTGNNYMPIRLQGFVIASSAPSTSLQLKIRQSAYCLFNYSPQRRNRLVMIGDSRTAGFKTDFKYTIATHLVEQIKHPISIYNLGNGSQTAQGMITTTVPTAVSTYDSTCVNFAVILAGINDRIITPSISESTVLGYLTTICTNLKMAGYKVIIIPELFHSNSSINTWLSNLRNLINANPMIADYICDVSSFTSVATPTNTSYYPDGIHLTSVINHEIASKISDYIDSVLQ